MNAAEIPQLLRDIDADATSLHDSRSDVCANHGNDSR